MCLKTSRGLPSRVQAHLLGKRTEDEALRSFLGELRIWVFAERQATSAANGFGYLWFNQADFYWGYAAEQRQRDYRPGLLARYLEHERLLIKTRKRQEVGPVWDAEFRYRVMAPVPAHATYFLPLLRDTAANAYAREQMAIRLVPSQCNKREKRPPDVKPRPARILPAWRRRKDRILSGESEIDRTC